MKNMSDKVCSEFFSTFPKYRKDVRNEERVAFMLTHPVIRSKLDEWVDAGDRKSEGKNFPIVSNDGSGRPGKKKSNVTNQLIEPDGSRLSTNKSTSDLEPKDHQQNNPGQCQHMKNPAQSAKQRESGNSLFKQKKLYESLRSYNEAIRLAPYANPDPEGNSLTCNECQDTSKSGSLKDEKSSTSVNSEAFVLSLANRSAVYFELGEDYYEESLNDANLALKHGYPLRLRHKLLLRKANIYVKRKEWDLAQNIIEQIYMDVEDMKGKDSEGSNLHPDAISKLKDLQVKIQEGSKVAVVDKHITTDSNNSEKFQSSFTENNEFENASVSIKLSYSDRSTRFVTATSDLTKGDVVFQEEPFASVLLPQFYETHCHHCHRMFKKDYFFPCRRCTQAKFCTESCSEAAWDMYHREECLSLDLLQSVGIAHLGARVILCAGSQAVLEAIKKHDFLCDPKNVPIFGKGFSNYERVYSLLDHLDDMHVEDVFQYTLTASLLTNWLTKKTTFVDALEEADKSKIGGAVLRHICQLICNAHAITDVLSDINIERISLSTSDESQQRIASAIFPAASMMNHSCDPNIAFGFVNGKKLIVKLITDLKTGDEVFNCYGPHFRRMNRKRRQETLEEQYFFDCYCKPCIEEKRFGTSFVETFLSFKCDECQGPVIPPDPDDTRDEFYRPCRQCNHSQDLNDQLAAAMYTDRLFQDGEVLLERGKVDQALKIFEVCYGQRQQFLYKFHSDLGQICDLIGRCYAILGDFAGAADYVKKSLTYVEKRFGSESLEYGREVQKYAQLLIQDNAEKHKMEVQRLKQIYQAILDFN